MRHVVLAALPLVAACASSPPPLVTGLPWRESPYAPRAHAVERSGDVAPITTTLASVPGWSDAELATALNDLLGQEVTATSDGLLLEAYPATLEVARRFVADRTRYAERFVHLEARYVRLPVEAVPRLAGATRPSPGLYALAVPEHTLVALLPYLDEWRERRSHTVVTVRDRDRARTRLGDSELTGQVWRAGDGALAIVRLEIAAVEPAFDLEPALRFVDPHAPDDPARDHRAPLPRTLRVEAALTWMLGAEEVLLLVRRVSPADALLTFVRWKAVDP